MQEYNSARPCRDAVQMELRKGGMFCEERVSVGMPFGTKRTADSVDLDGARSPGKSDSRCQVD